MARLNLQSKNKDNTNEKIVLDYLEKNASDDLAKRINAGEKTLAQCWNYIISEARKAAVGNCACIDDATVFGWAIHFFEEDEIKAKDYDKARGGTVVPASVKEASKMEKPKKAPKIEEEQISFDSFFN